MPFPKSLQFAFNLVVILGAGLAFGRDCPSGEFSNPDSNICHHCSLCDDPVIASKTPGCTVCAHDRDPSSNCQDGMIWHPEMQTCIHCSACSSITDKQKWENSGCNRCDDEISGNQEPSAEQKSTSLSPQTCKYGMVWNPDIQTCFHCSACFGIEDEDKRRNSGCDRCNSTDIKDSIDVNPKVDPHEPNQYSKISVIGIIVGSLLTITFTVSVVFKVTVFKKRKRATTNNRTATTSDRPDSREAVDTIVNMTDLTTAVTTSVKTYSGDSNPEISTEHITRTNTGAKSNRAANITNLEQRSDDNYRCTMIRPVEEEGRPGKRSDEWEMLNNEGQS